MASGRNINVWAASTAVVLGSLMPVMASASVVINLSKNTLPVGSVETLNIIGTATGTDATNGISGEDIYLQINDGGSKNGGSSTAPLITALDLSTGIFAGDANSGLTIDPSGGGLLAFDSISTPDTVSPPHVPIPVFVGTNGILGTITLDTSNMMPGSTFSIYFGNVGLNTTDVAFAGGGSSDYVDSTGTNSPDFSGPYGNTGTSQNPIYVADVVTITPVPEPSLGMLAGTVTGIGLLGRRGRSRVR